MTLGLRFLGFRQPRVRAKFRLRVLRWHGSLTAKVNKNANLGYSHTGVCPSSRLAYGCKTCVYPTNTLSATVAFLLLPDTNLLPQVAITTSHYSLLTAT